MDFPTPSFGETILRSAAINLPLAAVIIAGAVAVGMIASNMISHLSDDSAHSRFRREIAKSGVSDDVVVFFAEHADPIHEGLRRLMLPGVTDDVKAAVRAGLAASL